MITLKTIASKCLSSGAVRMTSVCPLVNKSFSLMTAEVATIPKYSTRTTVYVYLQPEKSRWFSSQPQKPSGFLGRVFENLKDEMEDKKFKKNLDDFHKEISAIESSKSIQDARKKFNKIEEETVEGAEKAKRQLKSIKEKVVEEAQKTEFIKKASMATEEATKQAQKVGQTIAEHSGKLADTQTFKTIQDTAKIVKEEIDQSAFGRAAQVYKPPVKLRRRTERDLDAEEKIIVANAEATGITLHKDSKFYENWEKFKNNSKYFSKASEIRTKIEESDNYAIRLGLVAKEKVTDMITSMFQSNEMSLTLTEICKVDPNFDKERFLLECEYVIIPNILEAMNRPDLEILEDWCFERVYNVYSAHVKQMRDLGWHMENKILDVDSVDLTMGKLLDEGPVLVLQFDAQTIQCIKKANGEVAEGSPDKVNKIRYVFCMCRDPADYNPMSAWRLLEYSASATEQVL